MKDDWGNAMPGVSVRDMGLKEGLNGVDNGIITFTRVRVPRENLLNRCVSLLHQWRHQCASGGLSPYACA